MIIAIDPGSEESAFVIWDGVRIVSRGKWANGDLLRWLHEQRDNQCVIEQIASYGMAVGAEVFETVFWSGRFMEAFGAHRCDRIKRLPVKLHLCHDSKAKDANIRQALIDRFGGKEKAIGKKASQGPLYGVSGDEWAALAVAITWYDLNITGKKVA